MKYLLLIGLLIVGCSDSSGDVNTNSNNTTYIDYGGGVITQCSNDTNCSVYTIDENYYENNDTLRID